MDEMRKSFDRVERSFDRLERTLYLGFAAIFAIWSIGCGVTITLILDRS
jgi:hypothetical protein